MWYTLNQNELYHHGIKGQKWYVRRFQNPDGTLTESGKRRYGKENNLAQVLSKAKDPDSVDVVKNLTKKQKSKLDRYREEARQISKENYKIESDMSKRLSRQFGGKKAYELTPEEFKLYDQLYQKEWRRIFGDPENADTDGSKYFHKKVEKLAKEVVGNNSDVPITSIWTGDTYTAEEFVRYALERTFYD